MRERFRTLGRGDAKGNRPTLADMRQHHGQISAHDINITGKKSTYELTSTTIGNVLPRDTRPNTKKGWRHVRRRTIAGGSVGDLPRIGFGSGEQSL